MNTKPEAGQYFNVAVIGDVVARPGRTVLGAKLTLMRQEHELDFVIVNGENVTHGKSLSYRHYQWLKSLGVDVITSGNHIYDLPEVLDYIGKADSLLRPLNLAPLLPGPGTVVRTVGTKTIRVTNLVGQVFMDPADNPFVSFEAVLQQPRSDIHVVDFHAETTSEKLAFALCYDGQVTAVVGTHTHVPTCDERILPRGTAFITDLGMTGNYQSVLGVEAQTIIDRLRLGIKKRFLPAAGSATLHGVVLKIDQQTNRVVKIYRVCYA